MAVGVLSLSRGAGISWREARLHADALLAGMRIVRALGNAVRPAVVAALPRIPRVVLAALLWLISRTSMREALASVHGQQDAQASQVGCRRLMRANPCTTVVSRLEEERLAFRLEIDCLIVLRPQGPAPARGLSAGSTPSAPTSFQKLRGESPCP